MSGDIDPHAIDQDWQGNNIALACPECSKVFIVSAYFHDGVRDCPNCGQVRAKVTGGRDSGGQASIEKVR